MRRTFCSTCILLGFSLMPSASSAQDTLSTPSSARLTEWGGVSLEAFVTRYWLDGGEDISVGGIVNENDRIDLWGAGLRLLLHNQPRAGFGGLLSRSSLGLFAVLTPPQDNDEPALDNSFRTLHYGAQVDFHIAAEPLGYADPFVSLGIGGFRREDRPTATTQTSSNTRFAFSPAVGSVFPIVRHFSVRADLRDVIIFERTPARNYKPSHNIELSGGLMFTFR